jgi:site-specific DNA-methyltransferase (adenine-specific)
MKENIINKLHTGNSIEFMKKHMDTNSIDLTVTSSPYDNLRNYSGYKFEFEEMACELFRVTKKVV